MAFISANSPNLNPVDYCILWGKEWGMLSDSDCQTEKCSVGGSATRTDVQ